MQFYMDLYIFIKNTAMKVGMIIYRFCLGLAFTLTLMTSCSKDEGKEEDKPPVPIDTDSVTVSSFSPEKPMWGDVITINGTGFGSNKAEVEVYFPGNYVPISDTLKSKGIIESVSNTQLKVKIPYHTEDKPDGYTYPLGIHNGWGNIVIKVKDKPTYTSPDYFVKYRAVPFINTSAITPIGVSGVYVVPGEKFKISGKGFGLNKNEGTLTVNGTVVEVDSVWGNVEAYGEGSWNLIATLPAKLGSKSKDLKSYTFTFARFGRSYSRTLDGQSLPRLSITSNTLPAQIIGGTSVTDFQINGKNLYANVIQFTSGSFNETVAVTGASLDASQVSAFVPLSTLLPYGNRTWNVTLKDTDVGSTEIGGWVIGSVNIKP